MKIEHLAIWVKDLYKMREFYMDYFNATSNELYHNPTKQFSSYFLTFDSGARLELMHKSQIKSGSHSKQEFFGYAHFAISLGSKEAVDQMTEKFRSNGLRVKGEPRTTGDGYYESVIVDPEGNLIELTV